MLNHLEDILESIFPPIPAGSLLNYYCCPECHHEWTNEWDCEVDDDCPECGERHISPFLSEDLLCTKTTLATTGRGCLPGPSPRSPRKDADR